MYEPSIGRFLTKDSWQCNYNQPQSLNEWDYVEGNPILYADPNGYKICSDDGFCGGLNDSGYQRHAFTQAITDVYKWKLSGQWSLNELTTIYNAGYYIEKYVDGISAFQLGLFLKMSGGFTITYIMEMARLQIILPRHLVIALLSTRYMEKSLYMIFLKKHIYG
jgi:hypothetical protein